MNNKKIETAVTAPEGALQELPPATIRMHSGHSMMQKIVRIKQVCQQPGFGDFTVSKMRHLVFNAEPRVAASGETIPGNGLREKGAIIRVGRRVYIDLEKFEKWILDHRET